MCGSLSMAGYLRASMLAIHAGQVYKEKASDWFMTMIATVSTLTESEELRYYGVAGLYQPQ